MIFQLSNFNVQSLRMFTSQKMFTLHDMIRRQIHLSSIRMEKPVSGLSVIKDCADNPITMFENILERVENKFIVMNIATIDKEFGVMNRSLIFRGFIDNCLAFVTETYTRKYQNIRANPCISVTFLFPLVSPPPCADSNEPELWQVRVFDAKAVELSDEQADMYWKRERPSTRIRSHLHQCGARINTPEFQIQHNALLKDFMNNGMTHQKTKTFTAFKIEANRWEFYKSHVFNIADRLEYKRISDNEWEAYHIAP